MRVHSFLTQGPSALSTLTAQLSQASSSIPPPIDALALFHLGVPRTDVASAVRASGISCPSIYLADSYGIIGYDEGLGRNVELMEKGRGQEYGYAGGSGGEGCVAILFSGGAVAGGSSLGFPEDLASMMVIEDTNNEFTSRSTIPPIHYGGVAKENYVLKDDGSLEPTPFFWVGSKENDVPVGISTFTGEADEACAKLMGRITKGYSLTGDVGLFPCYTRGINHYGKEDVESLAIASTFKGATSKNPRVYGMFAHGELGPSDFAGFVVKPEKVSCKKYPFNAYNEINELRKSVDWWVSSYLELCSHTKEHSRPPAKCKKCFVMINVHTKQRRQKSSVTPNSSIYDFGQLFENVDI